VIALYSFRVEFFHPYYLIFFYLNRYGGLMAEFMVVLRGGDPELKKYSSTEVQQIMEKYYTWVENLRRTGRYRGGSPLKEGSKVLSGHKGDLVVIQDARYAASAQALSGYFLIDAPTFGEAVEVAKSCPALAHGETVEVLELDNQA